MNFKILRTSCVSKRALSIALTVVALSVMGTHCDTVISQFDLGFDEGFARDDWYHTGYDDSFFTFGFEPILYRGDTIPQLDDFSFDAGFHDGTWYAYNDGYFVSYRDMFLIGFSEGYDNAFWGDYVQFLLNDIHIEFRNGGFSDAYNDGYSEGRIFGGFDYSRDLPFDWLDAYLDWLSGTDLFLDEVGIGTGELGPVQLYEWGTDPHTLKTVVREGKNLVRKGMREMGASQHKGDVDIARPFTPEQEHELDIVPETSLRDDIELRLTTTWLERILDAEDHLTAPKRRAYPSSSIGSQPSSASLSP